MLVPTNPTSTNPMYFGFDSQQWFVCDPSQANSLYRTQQPAEPSQDSSYDLSSAPSESEDEESRVLSSPDSDVEEKSPPSSFHSLRDNDNFVLKMAASLNIPIHHPAPRNSDHLFDQIDSDALAPVPLSVIPSFLLMMCLCDVVYPVHFRQTLQDGCPSEVFIGIQQGGSLLCFTMTTLHPHLYMWLHKDHSNNYIYSHLPNQPI
ncbi:hypothetical protein JRQ81_003648 [Phrynocephalus forsythii]|uniref:Uncharacterized protein n=1 Tax=Phrynocephalus forsythii TaxID=171643 RepID=A0A9Q0XL10_9SAUR|nr:hypothetical protein JRQ81_003648 [Phrynocephalus forsythii]